MNSEINFIERRPNKFTPFIKLGIIFVLLIVCVFTLILMQKNNLENQMETQSDKLDQLESVLKENQATMADKQQLEQLDTVIKSMKSSRIPTVDLYQNVLALLPNAEQLMMYDNGEANQIIVGAKFKALSEVAAYVSALLRQNYITGTELTSVSFTQSVYQATLTVSIDPDISVKELANHE